MPRCIVQGCPHYSGRKNSTPGISFFMFPKNLSTIKKWLLHINPNFGDLDMFAQVVLEGKAGAIRICSAHFTSECYHFDGSQKMLLDNAVPTIFPSKEASTIKVETAIPTVNFPKEEETGVKVQGTMSPAMFPKEKKSLKVEEAAVPPKIFRGRKKLLADEKTSTPPVYWNVQPLGIPSLPFIHASLGNQLWTNNGFPLSNLSPWSPNVKSSRGATVGEEHCLDTLVPQANDKASATTVDSHGENLSSPKVNYKVEDFLSVQDVEIPAFVPDATCELEITCTSSSPAEVPPVQMEDKAVQWPEYETRGMAWKVLHDHYYKVRTVFDRSSLKYGVESCYEEVESEGELLATLQYVTSVLLRNKNRDIRTAKILNQTLEIIALVTGEEWVIVKKDSIHRGIHELTGEIPVKCGEVAVFFTLDEWSYIQRHKQEFSEVVTDHGPLSRTWEVQEHWDSESSITEEEEEEDAEEEIEDSPKRKSSPEWRPDCEYSDFEVEKDEEEETEEVSYSQNGVDGASTSEFIRRTDTDGEDGAFFCDKCNASFPNQKTLKKHLKSHANDPQFVCEACGEHVSSKADLIRHKAENHAVKRYPCPICGIQYDYKSQFIIHQRAHTGEKPFVCQVCGAKFGHKSSFLVHERRHKAGKTFECDKCDRRFDKRCELTKHVKTHGQKKRHKCHKCGRQYSTRSALMRHKWDHKDE
ncbi:uncharacterized protein [Hyperolius riggenbachi]|uniref:uncharacterized protein n=1 Tax=Hyperolius riggenbachi TaxID=752182 RepID=UPI0035A35ACC